MSDFLGNVLDEAEVASDPVEAAPEVEEVSDAGEVEAEQQASEPDTGVETSPPEVSQDEAKKRQGYEAALLAERRKRQEAEAELNRLRNAGEKPKEADDQAPQFADFETIEDYSRAVARYEIQQAKKAEETRAEQKKAEDRQQQEQVELRVAVDNTVARGRQAHRDFDEAINTGLAPFLNDQLVIALANAENGHEVAYHLAKDAAEARRIAELNPVQQLREILKLELKLASKPVEQEQKPALPQTLTQTRNAAGRFESPSGYTGPTPLDDVLGRKT